MIFKTKMKYMKNLLKQKYYLFLIFFTAPSVVFAAGTLNDVEDAILSLLNSIIPLFLALAVTFFIWNVLKYINSGDNAELREQARAMMIYGIVAIFVLVSIWGFVDVLVDAFNLNNNVPVNFGDIILEM